MAVHLKLEIAYDGTHYGGWQRQKHDASIQQKLEEAVQKICGRNITIFGASRTDAGVHALRQCASLAVPEKKMAVDDWLRAINAHLPRDIRVIKVSAVSAKFHAQYAARSKIYEYRIWNHRVLPPFEVNRAWQVPVSLDVAAMKRAARWLIGKHDFSSLASQSRDPRKTNVRTIKRISLRKSGPLITVTVEGDGFLYKMVRAIVGTLVDVGKGRIPANDMKKILAAKDRKLAGQNAPAQGLYLVKVKY